MAFFDLAFLSPDKVAEHSSQVPPDLPEQQFLAVLRREHDDMVLALPCRVAQVIVI